MVELVEYLLAFGISAALAAASVALLHGAIPGITQLATQSEADQIASGATTAVIEGKSIQLVLPLQQTTIGCEGGTLSLRIQNSSYISQVMFPCSFQLGNLNGSCTLVFSAPSDSLSLTASCS